MSDRSTKLATAGGLGAILLWSTTFAFARSLSEQVGPLTAASVVYLIGGALCAGRFLVRGGTAKQFLEQRSRAYLIGCGLLFLFYTGAIYVAVGMARDREQLVEVALVNYLWPTATILLSIPILGKQGGAMLLPGTVLALAGIFLVITQGSTISWASVVGHLRGNPFAYGLTFTAAVAWGFYSNLARRWSTPGSVGGIALFLPATGIVLFILGRFASEHGSWNPRAIVEVATLGTVTGLAYAFWDLAMRRGNLLLVAVCSYFTPLFSTVVSCVYLGVSPSPRLLIGCALLILGSILTWRAVR